MNIYRLNVNESNFFFTNKKKAIKAFNINKNTISLGHIKLCELNESSEGVYVETSILMYCEKDETYWGLVTE